MELCRLCAKTNTENSQKLFERNQRKLLRQVEELTQLQLKNGKDLPHLICETCQEQTLQAHLFRAVCIRVQHYFSTAEYKRKIKAPPIEEVVLHEPIKKEDEAAEVLQKNTTPCNADDDDVSSDNSFNPLEMSAIVEPEMSLCADNEPAQNSKTAARKPKSRERPHKTFRKKSSASAQKEKKDYICDQCGIRYPSGSTSAFFMHKLRHAEKRYQCEICPKMYYTKAILNRHMAKHSVKSGEEPFPCKFCDRRFMNYSSKVRHERNHTNDRPFACNECEKTFTQKQYLENHLLTHTGERAFICRWCNMSFKRKTHLVTHYRSLVHKQNEEKQQ